MPGAIVAVLLLIGVSTALDSSADGVPVIGAVQGGFPPIGLPQGITLDDVTANMATLLGIGFSCFILIIAQSAATSRSFAMKHGQPVNINRDILGLSGANFAAGLSGTFVVNGSPTKTQILDGQKGRTQLANATMAVGHAAGAAVLHRGPDEHAQGRARRDRLPHRHQPIDIKGLRIVLRMSKGEFVIAVVTAVVVCAVGVEQGIILAIVVSILNIIRRQYRPKDYVVSIDAAGEPTYSATKPGTQSAPGPDHVPLRRGAVLRQREPLRRRHPGADREAPTRCEWLILDASSLDSIDYSAGKALEGLADYLEAQERHARARARRLRAARRR